MASPSSRTVLLALAALAACSGRAPPSPPGATSPDAAVAVAPASAAPGAAQLAAAADGGPDSDPTPPAVADGGAAAADAGVPGAPLSSAVAVMAGRDVAIERDGSTLVDPSASFRVEIGVPLSDGRLALHDEQDAMVASSGTSEVGTTWTRYRLVPDEPLRPGTTYALRVDGAAAREVHDPAGRAYAPIVLKLKTTGERPAPPPAKRKRSKRRS